MPVRLVARFAPGSNRQRQGKKGRLESVFSVVQVVQHAQTDIEDHLRVPPESQLKARLIAVDDEAVEKLGIADPARFRGQASNPAPRSMPACSQFVPKRLAIPPVKVVGELLPGYSFTAW